METKFNEATNFKIWICVILITLALIFATAKSCAQNYSSKIVNCRVYYDLTDNGNCSGFDPYKGEVIFDTVKKRIIITGDNKDTLTILHDQSEYRKGIEVLICEAGSSWRKEECLVKVFAPILGHYSVEVTYSKQRFDYTLNNTKNFINHGGEKNSRR